MLPGIRDGVPLGRCPVGRRSSAASYRGGCSARTSPSRRCSSRTRSRLAIASGSTRPSSSLLGHDCICFKLGIRFNDAAMVKRFLASGRSGYYLRIAAEGHLAASDPIEVLARHPAGVAVSELTRLSTRDRDDTEGLRRRSPSSSRSSRGARATRRATSPGYPAATVARSR